jgi:hypothetical protein
MMKRILRYAAAGFLVGCAGKAVDVGSDHSSITEDGGPGGWPTLAACKSGDQLPIVGTWAGYMEMANLPSRSDAVKLVISAANAEHVCGTITFGTGTPPPVPTDPDNGNIPGFGDGGPISDYGSYLIDGFPLTILNAKASLPRLQFETNGSQFWKPWCERQTPYLRAGSTDEWHCVPLDANGSVTYTPATGCLLGTLDNGTPVNCAKANLCGGAGACSCSATGCTVSGLGGGMQFDLRVTGNEIHGPGLNSHADMHLTRVP